MIVVRFNVSLEKNVLSDILSITSNIKDGEFYEL